MLKHYRNILNKSPLLRINYKNSAQEGNLHSLHKGTVHLKCSKQRPEICVQAKVFLFCIEALIKLPSGSTRKRPGSIRQCIRSGPVSALFSQKHTKVLSEVSRVLGVFLHAHSKWQNSTLILTALIKIRLCMVVNIIRFEKDKKQWKHAFSDHARRLLDICPFLSCMVCLLCETWIMFCVLFCDQLHGVA